VEAVGAKWDKGLSRNSLKKDKSKINYTKIIF
jgi:hypothetical protein